MPWPFDDPDDDENGPEIPLWPCGGVEVTETENLVIATLYGPTGDVLVERRERRSVPFGYTSPREPA